MRIHQILPILFIYFFSICIISCRSSTPEAILGLELGKNWNLQLQELINKGEIKEDGDRLYIPYSTELIGIISADSVESNGSEIITSIIIFFDNPNKFSGIPEIDQNEKEYLLNQYFTKYGKIELKPQRGEEYIWDKGDMLITLNFLEDSRHEKITYTAFANYSYKKEIIETLKAKAKRTNKKI